MINVAVSSLKRGGDGSVGIEEGGNGLRVEWCVDLGIEREGST